MNTHRRSGRAGGLDFSKSVSRTKQEMKAETDINEIMKRYIRFGTLPPGVGIGRYGDFSKVEDYQAALNLVMDAEGQFAALPARVRDRFQNDPSQLLAFVQDAKNLEEARKLGLLREEPVEASPVKVEVVSTTAPVVK